MTISIQLWFHRRLLSGVFDPKLRKRTGFRPALVCNFHSLPRRRYHYDLRPTNAGWSPGSFGKELMVSELYSGLDFNGQREDEEEMLFINGGSRPQHHHPFAGGGDHDENNTTVSSMAFLARPDQPAFSDFSFNFIPPEIQSNLLPRECTNPTSLDLLNHFGAGLKKLRIMNGSDGGDHDGGGATGSGYRKYSTEEIIRIAGARYIQFCDLSYDDFSMVMHPFGHALTGLSQDDTKDVELVHLLLAAAEKVAYEQYERACRLLSRCDWISSDKSNPVKRVVWFFAQALRDRMDIETGIKKPPSEPNSSYDGVDHDPEGWRNPTILKLYQSFPLLQTMYFAAVQTVVENVSSASKIHVIDFEIRSGVQWTIFMQAITERSRINPVEQLKITAVGVAGQNNLEEVGRGLISMADSLKLNFSFKALYVADMSEVREKMFEVASGEAVVVYCSLFLRMIITEPERLEHMMKVIKRLNPAVMVVIEVEANLNSPTYVGRFIEALFFYGAFFDCLEECTVRQKQCELKLRTELILYAGIRNIVATEGKARTTRSVKMEVWRAFFARFGMVEIGVSESAFHHANLVIRRYPAVARWCSLENNGKGAAVAWKGTPFYCLSAWKFPKERGRVYGTYTLDLLRPFHKQN